MNNKIIKDISLGEAEEVAFNLAKSVMSYNEPIPDFSIRFPNILESCLITPFQKFDNKYVYKGLISKAANLFYFMIKNHPFQNGNKRIAMTTLMYFLYKNDKWLNVDQQEFYNFCMWVAESNAKFKAETVQAVEKFLKSYLIDK